VPGTEDNPVLPPANRTTGKKVSMSRGTRWALGICIALLIVIGIGNLWSGYLETRHFEQQFTAAQAQAATEQKKAAQLVEQRLCATLVSLAALKPPAGTAGSNPSRAYEQQLGAKLAQLSTDIQCKAAQ
jgi:hypothetical protein